VREWGGESYRRLLANFKKTKNLGASALDICFVAAGRVEVVVYGTLTTKDIAPALGFLYEAGGVASTPGGDPVVLSDTAQRVYAANNETTLSFVRTLLEQS
jgi:fructose-1,6-bisphosphatase/inositol monophosphatase family enzyme